MQKTCTFLQWSFWKLKNWFCVICFLTVNKQKNLNAFKMWIHPNYLKKHAVHILLLFWYFLELHLSEFAKFHHLWRSQNRNFPLPFWQKNYGWVQNEDQMPKTQKMKTPSKSFWNHLKWGSNMILDWSSTRNNKICVFHQF